MKVLTLLGTRPEIIRLSRTMAKLDKVCDHKIVFTQQNFAPELSDIFWTGLGLRKPDYIFKKTNSIGEFLSNGFLEFENILNKERPDKILILGDTNSVLFGILAAKRGISIYHCEAGNRCYDPLVPEETNRVIIDACSRYNLPYTENSKENLIREQHSKNFVYKIGNPIYEVLDHYAKEIDRSDILMKLDLMPYSQDALLSYALLSFHRTENVDNPKRARQVVEAMNEVAEDMPVVYSFHPRTKDQFSKHGIKFSDKVKLIEPCGFFDFVKLEQYASVVFTDSGTVPEETMFFKTPTVVLRNTTERQELMETGTLILAGTKKDDILRAYKAIRTLPQKWDDLPDYYKLNVSDTIVRLLLGQDEKATVKGHDEY